MGTRVVIARTARRTGELLAGLLRQRGIPDGEDAYVCYGVGIRDNDRVLNGNCSRYNKLEQLGRLGDVPHVEAFVEPSTDQQAYPVFARKLQHTRGKDMRVCLQEFDARFYLDHGWDFLTCYEPSDNEYRVWIYRRRHLGTYHKVLAHPELALRQMVGYGRNYGRGWAFQLMASEQVPRDVVEVSSRAVDKLGLDFGAVDVMTTARGPVVLEVNTAPGVEGPGRQVIQALANKIARWVELGYPRRNGARNAE